MDWDSNNYFRQLFLSGRQDTKFNMKCTMHNLLIGGFIQKALNYVTDTVKK